MNLVWSTENENKKCNGDDKYETLKATEFHEGEQYATHYFNYNYHNKKHSFKFSFQLKFNNLLARLLWN